MQACTVRLEIAFSTFKQKQPSFTHAHTLVNTKTQTMLIVSYLSSRQFTGYRISAKLILSSVSKYRECLHGSWHSQLDERNASPPFLHALHLSSYIPIARREVDYKFSKYFSDERNKRGESPLLCEFRSNLAFDSRFVLLRYRTTGSSTVVIQMARWCHQR